MTSKIQRRLAELVEVDEVRTFNSLNGVGLAVRVGSEEASAVVPFDVISERMERALARTLDDLAYRARLRAEMKRKSAEIATWLNSPVGRIAALVATPDPTVLVDAVELRGASQTVRFVNVDEPAPANRFEAIAEEMKNA